MAKAVGATRWLRLVMEILLLLAGVWYAGVEVTRLWKTIARNIAKENGP